MVTVLYFAWMRERAGVGEESFDLPASVATVGALAEHLAARHPEAFARRDSIRAAVNQTFASPETAVADGDEVAFFPPVTGG